MCILACSNSYTNISTAGLPSKDLENVAYNCRICCCYKLHHRCTKCLVSYKTSLQEVWQLASKRR